MCLSNKVLALNRSIKFILKSQTQIRGENGVIEQLVTNGVATKTFPVEAEMAAAVAERTLWLPVC